MAGTALAVGGALLLPGGGAAQLAPVTGYYLHATAVLEGSALNESGVLDVQRLRLMNRPRWGRVSFDLAWEHVVTLRSGQVELGRGFGEDRSGIGRLNLDGTLARGSRGRWVHGVDRLGVTVPVGERTRITVGRQTVSWATTLYFTPADPFVPFDPADPFREYRAGVDAVRAVVATGPFSRVEGVVRVAPGLDGEGESITALGRWQGMVGGVEMSGWGGVVHDEPAAAVGFTGSRGEWSIRGEGGVRKEGSRAVIRGAVGVDRRFEVGGRDLRFLTEFQHDGFGASRPEELFATALSPAARRGELQLLGRDALAVNVGWQLHPLTEVGVLTLVNLRDGSSLWAPTLTHSLGDETALRVGAFAGVGPGARVPEGAPIPILRSEHGMTPLVGFAALTWFF